MVERVHKITKHWTCKDGTKIRICDMSDSHLINTINMLVRVTKENHSAELRAAYSVQLSLCSQDSIAAYYIENDIQSMEEEGPNPFQVVPLFDDLYSEALSRNLDIIL